jgi:shikimate dehydrogenase
VKPAAITAATRLAAVIGDPVEHSQSPALHNAAFAALGIDAVFVALRVESDRLAGVIDTLAAVGALGASVTVPHKEAALACCHRVSDDAARIGAVNCLELSEGEVIGHNTDAGGFADALRESLGDHPDGYRPLVLGGGGAARAVCVGLAAMTDEVPVIARSPERVTWSAAEPWTPETLAARLPQTNLLIDCTSSGLSVEGELGLPAVIDLDLLPGDAMVASLVYHREPRLLAEARARGLATLDGAGMLVHQARRALEIWTGKVVAPAVLYRAMGREPPISGH